MGRPPRFRREDALLRAEIQFRKTGYVGTNLDDIAAVTGLGRGSLYNAFGDKHALFMLALDAYCTRTVEKVAAMLAGPDDEALDRLEAYIRYAARAVVEDEDHLGCMAGKFALELEPGVDAEAGTRMQSAFEQLRDVLARCIESAQRHGDLDPAAPPGDLACLLLALSRGFDVVSRGGLSAAEVEGAARQAAALLPRTVR